MQKRNVLTQSFFTDNRDDPVTDNLTSLIWLKNAKGSRKNKFTELVPGFGSGLVDLIERNHMNSRLFRGFRE